MTIVLNATTGISTPPVTVLGDTSGSISIVAPAVAGTNTQTLLAATGTLSPFNSDTAKTAPPTIPQYFEFTGIPSWVRRVTVMFSGLSGSGTSIPIVQLGDSGGIEATGYVSASDDSITIASSTLGFLTASSSANATLAYGCMIISLVGSNRWVAMANVTHDRTGGNIVNMSSSGGKTLSDTLTQLRITTVGGSDTFDAGTINVLYE